MLEIGGNRAIDLIVAKESGAGQPRFGAGSGRALGEHPTLGGAVSVKQGRFGAYVNHGKVNATLPKGTSIEALTLDEAVAALAAKAAGGGAGGRMLGEHPDGGADHRARRTLRRLCQLGQGQRDDPQIDRARRDHPAGRDRADRGARGQAGQARAKARGGEGGGGGQAEGGGEEGAPAKGKAAEAKPAPPAKRKA